MRTVMVKMIRVYQIFLSPFLGKNCRFYPTCSAYSIEAIEKKGVLKGSLMALWRILRCNPWFGQGGYDPVDKFTHK